MSDKNIYIVKANGEKEIFNPSKLENSLIRSGADHATVDEIVRHVAAELKDGMSTSQIYKTLSFCSVKSKSQWQCVTHFAELLWI